MIHQELIKPLISFHDGWVWAGRILFVFMVVSWLAVKPKKRGK